MGGTISRGEALGVVAWGVAWFARYDFGSSSYMNRAQSQEAGLYNASVRTAIAPLTPAWFGVVWFLLYLANAAASYHFWRDFEPSTKYTTGIALLAVNVLLNKLWSPLFFGMRRPVAALLDLILVLGSAIWLQYIFGAQAHHADSGWWAFFLFAPYTAWLLAAGFLNVRFIVTGAGAR